MIKILSVLERSLIDCVLFLLFIVLLHANLRLGPLPSRRYFMMKGGNQSNLSSVHAFTDRFL